MGGGGGGGRGVPNQRDELRQGVGGGSGRGGEVPLRRWRWDGEEGAGWRVGYVSVVGAGDVRGWGFGGLGGREGAKEGWSGWSGYLGDLGDRGRSGVQLMIAEA